MLTGKLFSHSEENPHVHGPKTTPLLSIVPKICHAELWLAVYKIQSPITI